MRVSHIGWNLIGLTLPLAMAAVAVPPLIDTLGSERFGLLALCWGLIGYAGALDLGIGRAVTQYVARLNGGPVTEQTILPLVLSTAVRITLITGSVAALGIVVVTAFGIGELINVSAVSYTEINISLILLAIALPMQAISATYRGINEAFLNFRGISLIRIVLGISNFGLPLLVSFYSIRMPWIVVSLVISRGVALYAYRALANQCLGKSTQRFGSNYSTDIAVELFRFGGWFTVSSVLNPAVGSADRLIIASTVSAAAVSTYVIPYELVVQSLVLVGAVTAVAFPYLSQLRMTAPSTVRVFFYRLLALSSIMMIFVAFSYNIFGEALMRIWLGANVNSEIYEAMRILTFGLVPYTIGTMSTAMLHAYGRTKVTATINAIEFPLFIALIYFLTQEYGVLGAAYAWVLRVTVDAILFLFFSIRCK